MATPTYKGQSQPTASSGGWLSNWFGGSTPAYISAAATAPTATAAANAPSNVPTRPRSFFALAAPAYKLASASTESGSDVDTTTEIAIVIPRQALDPQT
jgi:hypothetical protein